MGRKCVCAEPRRPRRAGPAAAESRADRVEAEVLAVLPPYVPAEKVSGAIRVWGHGSLKRPFLRRLVTLWTGDFRRWHPDCTIEQDRYGTSSAIPALFTGVGDLAIPGEAADTFTRATGYPPFGVEIATGSVDRPQRRLPGAAPRPCRRQCPQARLRRAEPEYFFSGSSCFVKLGTA